MKETSPPLPLDAGVDGSSDMPAHGRRSARPIRPPASRRPRVRSPRCPHAPQKARALIADYYEQQLLALLEHVRDGFTRLDRSEIDAFELDELIHRYKRSARELWKFCGQTGSSWERAARTLEWLCEEGEEPDWWQAGEPRRRRS
jgi:hypothetical protein